MHVTSRNDTQPWHVQNWCCSGTQSVIVWLYQDSYDDISLFTHPIIAPNTSQYWDGVSVLWAGRVCNTALPLSESVSHRPLLCNYVNMSCIINMQYNLLLEDPLIGLRDITGWSCVCELSQTTGQFNVVEQQSSTPLTGCQTGSGALDNNGSNFLFKSLNLNQLRALMKTRSLSLLSSHLQQAAFRCLCPPTSRCLGVLKKNKFKTPHM